LKLKNSLKQLIDQVLVEHEFGAPWKWAENAGGLLIPILRIALAAPREYIILEEAKGKVIIQDTGDINKAKLTNNTGKTVFVRGGTLLNGEGTQSRAVQTGIIVPPGKHEIPINCVHASHHISSGASFKFDGYTPRKVMSALRTKNQGEVWNSVSHYSDECRSQAFRRNETNPRVFEALRQVPADNLVSNLKTVNQFKSDVNDAIRRMPRFENQVGVVIFDLNGVVGLELFDSPDSWMALSEEVIRQYTDVIEQKLPDYLNIDMDKVVVNIKAFLELAKQSIEQQEENVTTILIGKVAGEYTKLKNRLIHLLLAREEKTNGNGNKQPTPRGSGHFSMRFDNQMRSDSFTNGTLYYDKSMINPPRQNPCPVTTDFEERYFSHVKSKELLLELKKEPKSWSDLSVIFSKSVSTQQRIIDEAIALGYVTKEGTTKPIYKLTAKGHEALNNAEKQ
jgi:hypothetical protein